jgi:hypothetical protein
MHFISILKIKDIIKKLTTIDLVSQNFEAQYNKHMPLEYVTRIFKVYLKDFHRKYI